jgi:two-component system, cell cycle response regulator
VARGHEVIPFNHERDALAQIRTDLNIEALITSAELRHTSGVELCWETRLLATCSRPIYVLMMSTQYDQRSLIEAPKACAAGLRRNPSTPARDGSR